MKNFLGLDRGIREHWVYKDSQYFHCWSEMLLLARYSEEPLTEMYEGEIVTVKYGEFIFGRPSWGSRLNISDGKLKRFIEKLVKDTMIVKVKQYRKCTVYKLVNYEEYNKKRPANDHQNDQQSDQQKTLIQQGLDLFSDQQSDQRMTIKTTNKEDSKEVKNKNTLYRFAEFWDMYPKSVSRPDAESAWKSMLKRMNNEPEPVFNALKNYIQQIQDEGTEKKYIKNAATFLNKDRWKDHESYTPSTSISDLDKNIPNPDEREKERRKLKMQAQQMTFGENM
jgi:hypothetical protein